MLHWVTIMMVILVGAALVREPWSWRFGELASVSQAEAQPCDQSEIYGGDALLPREVESSHNYDQRRPYS